MGARLACSHFHLVHGLAHLHVHLHPHSHLLQSHLHVMWHRFHSRAHLCLVLLVPVVFSRVLGPGKLRVKSKGGGSSPSGDLLPDLEVGTVGRVREQVAQKKVQCADQDQEPGYKGKVR